jgi:hypothetical protein
VQAGNQQYHQQSPSNTANPGVKNKKIINQMSNGTIGGSTHGYGPIGGGIPSLMSTGGGTMNINVYKGGNSSTNQNIKDSISFSKINSKMKKK